MENNIALNLRETANQVNETKEAKKMAHHQAFVDNKVIPYLQEIAESGKYQADVNIPDCDVNLVCEILTKMGFSVSQYKNYRHLIVVKW